MAEEIHTCSVDQRPDVKVLVDGSCGRNARRGIGKGRSCGTFAD